MGVATNPAMSEVTQVMEMSHLCRCHAQILHPVLRWNCPRVISSLTTLKTTSTMLLSEVSCQTLHHLPSQLQHLNITGITTPTNMINFTVLNQDTVFKSRTYKGQRSHNEALINQSPPVTTSIHVHGGCNDTVIRQSHDDMAMDDPSQEDTNESQSASLCHIMEKCGHAWPDAHTGSGFTSPEKEVPKGISPAVGSPPVKMAAKCGDDAKEDDLNLSDSHATDFSSSHTRDHSDPPYHRRFQAVIKFYCH